MSALAVDHGRVARQPEGCPDREGRRAPSRPALVLVPAGADYARGHTVRVTRAGRLALTLTVVAMVAAVALLTMAGSGSGGSVDHAVTVAPGQTLSDIAVRELPGLPMREAVVGLQLANNLSSSQVSAGQVILVPSS